MLNALAATGRNDRLMTAPCFFNGFETCQSVTYDMASRYEIGFGISLNLYTAEALDYA